MLFWRQLSHWLGGMGIIVLAVAILPRLRIGGRQLLQSELAGPTEIEQLGDTIRSTARRLWRLYVVLTLVAIGVLMFLSVTNLDDVMTPFDAVGQALSVVALGGFSTRTVSIAAFAPITQYVILVFMVIAGINFLRLYRFFVQRRVEVLVKDEELRLYLALILIGATLIAIEVIGGGYEHGEAGIRHSLFQATAILTTTGFATADYALWGSLATVTLLLLMFSGASRGIDRRRHQDRPPPAAVQARQARARADRASRGRSSRSASTAGSWTRRRCGRRSSSSCSTC